MFEIEHYLAPNDIDVFARWIQGLGDRRASARIAARIERLACGLFGDCKPLRDGVWELRIDTGAGYRVYYAQSGRRIILLLCAGAKDTQRKDIQRAVDYWNDYQERAR